MDIFLGFLVVEFSFLVALMCDELKTFKQQFVKLNAHLTIQFRASIIQHPTLNVCQFFIIGCWMIVFGWLDVRSVFVILM